MLSCCCCCCWKLAGPSWFIVPLVTWCICKDDRPSHYLSRCICTQSKSSSVILTCIESIQCSCKGSGCSSITVNFIKIYLTTWASSVLCRIISDLEEVFWKQRCCLCSHTGKWEERMDFFLFRLKSFHLRSFCLSLRRVERRSPQSRSLLLSRNLVVLWFHFWNCFLISAVFVVKWRLSLEVNFYWNQRNSQTLFLLQLT